jgi:hypothetical protein
LQLDPCFPLTIHFFSTPCFFLAPCLLRDETSARRDGSPSSRLPVSPAADNQRLAAEQKGGNTKGEREGHQLTDGGAIAP